MEYDKERELERLKSTIHADVCNSVIFEAAQNLDIYLVGGYIRDLLLGREGRDRDYVVKGDLMKFLAVISAGFDCKVIRIGKKDLFRMVLRNGLILDFTQLKDKKIDSNLSDRDFTINGLAWSPKKGFIDLHNGLNDLFYRSVRMINEENMKKDPVRIIRAYRIADELSFHIEKNTRETIKILCEYIKKAQAERITLEFFKILNKDTPVRTLKMMLEDNVLGSIFSHKYKELNEFIKSITKVSGIINKLPLKYRLKLEEVFSQELTGVGFLNLLLLVKKKPDRHIFLLSKKILKYIFLIKKAETFVEKRKDLKKDELYDLFKVSETASLYFLIMQNWTKYLKEMESYLEIQKRGILSAHEIIKAKGLPEGKERSNVIDKLKKAEFTGRIRSRKGALAFLSRI